MNILKKLFSSSRPPSPQTPLEHPYLKPIQILELGGSGNGTSYLGIFSGQDDQKYVIGFPRPIGSNPAIPGIRILGKEDAIRITGEELSIISSELRRLTSQSGQSFDSYAAEYLDALEAIASSQGGSSPAIPISIGPRGEPGP